jgi:hypothetical protein
MTVGETHVGNIALAKMRAAVLYLPCGVLCIVRVLRHDSVANPALRQALKRYVTFRQKVRDLI